MMRTHGTHGADYHDGDQSRYHAIFDGSDAGFIGQKGLKRRFHWEHPQDISHLHNARDCLKFEANRSCISEIRKTKLPVY